MSTFVSQSIPLDVKTGRSERLLRLLSECTASRHCDALLLSGGLDSSLLAAIDSRPIAITVGLKGKSTDVEAAARVAGHLGLNWHCVEVDEQQMMTAVERLVVATGSYNPGILHDIPLLLGIEHAKCIGAKSVRSGEAADILFGGYSSASQIADYITFLRRTISRMTLRASRLCAVHGISSHDPYFDRKVREFAITLRSEERQISVVTDQFGDIYEEKMLNSIGGVAPTEKVWGKIILRRCALGLLPTEIVFRQKQDSGFGSGAEIVEQLLANQIFDVVYRRMVERIHPFYGKAHARLFQIYHQKCFAGVTASAEGYQGKRCVWCRSPIDDSHHCYLCGAYAANKGLSNSDSLDVLQRTYLRRAFLCFKTCRIIF